MTEQTGRTSAGLLRIQKSEQLFDWKLLFYLQIMVIQRKSATKPREITSRLPVIRPLKSHGAHRTLLPGFVFHRTGWTVTRCCVKLLTPTEALCETIHNRAP